MRATFIQMRVFNDEAHGQIKGLASVINSSVKTLYLIFLDQKLAFNNLLGYFYFQNFVALPWPGYGSAGNGD